MFEGDLIGFDKLPPMNATEPPGVPKIFSRTRAKHVCLNGRTDPF